MDIDPCLDHYRHRDPEIRCDPIDFSRISTSPLGPMDKAPAEIRNMIFKECIKNRSIGLFRANKRLYFETISLVREGFSLAFHIDPAVESSVVNILNQNGNTINVASSHRDPILDMMPIDKFRQIHIVLEAPDKNDPGQLIRGWYQTTRLLAALLPQWRNLDQLPMKSFGYHITPRGRRSNRLPPVVIEFRGSKTRQWSHDSLQNENGVCERVWNHSVPSYKAWDADTKEAENRPEDPHSDIEILLIPFCRIRDVESVTVKLPEERPQNERVNNKLIDLREMTKSEVPFGVRPVCIEDVDADLVLAWENCQHVWLEYLLDDLEGPTADMLRRERFQNWCPEHEYFQARAVQGHLVSLPFIATADGTQEWLDIGSPAHDMGDALVDHLLRQCHVRYAAGRRHGQHLWDLLDSGRYIATYLTVDDNDNSSNNNKNNNNNDNGIHNKGKCNSDSLTSPNTPRGGAAAATDRWELHYPDGIKRKSENPSWPTGLVIDARIDHWLHPLSRRSRTWCHSVGKVGTTPCACDHDGIAVNRPRDLRLRAYLDEFLQDMPFHEGLEEREGWKEENGQDDDGDMDMDLF